MRLCNRIATSNNSTQQIRMGETYSLPELCKPLGIETNCGYSKNHLMSILRQHFEFEVIERPNRRPKYYYKITKVKNNASTTGKYCLSPHSKYINEATILFAYNLKQQLQNNRRAVVLTFNDIGDLLGIIPPSFADDYKGIVNGTLDAAHYKTVGIVDYAEERQNILTFFSEVYHNLCSVVNNSMHSIDKLGLYTRQSTLFYYQTDGAGNIVRAELNQDQVKEYWNIKREVLLAHGNTDYSLLFTSFVSRELNATIRKKMRQKYPDIESAFYSGYTFDINAANVDALLLQFNISDSNVEKYAAHVRGFFKDRLTNFCQQYYEKNKLIIGSAQNAPVNERFSSVYAGLLDFYYRL